MLEPQEIQVGRVYVNTFTRIARQVVAINRWAVEYRCFILANGSELPGSRCSVAGWCRWATREATDLEYSVIAGERMGDDDAQRGLQSGTSALRQALVASMRRSAGS